MCAINQKTLQLYEQIKEKDPISSNIKCDFSASTGWLTKIFERYAFHNIKLKGEAASRDELAAREFIPKLSKII